jgi:hypothetical protein
MEFIISRTSICNDDEKPHERAYLKKIRYEVNEVQRGQNCWCIKIKNLKELISFKDEVNYSLVIRDSVMNINATEIEIYDNYRE